MKKLLLSLLFVILIGLLPLAAEGQQAPAPFEKIKELALRASPDTNGRYQAHFQETFDSGKATVHMIGYLPKSGHIGIGILFPMVLIVEFNERSREFSLIRDETRYIIAFEGHRNIIIEQAFEFFKVWIEKGLVQNPVIL